MCTCIHVYLHVEFFATQLFGLPARNRPPNWVDFVKEVDISTAVKGYRWTRAAQGDRGLGSGSVV